MPPSAACDDSRFAEAVTLQRDHRFGEALAALDDSEASEGPGIPSLRLRATIRLVQGDYGNARRSAAAMALAGDQFGAFVFGGIIAGETGSAAAAEASFSAAMARAGHATPRELSWCLTAMAELAARENRGDEARVLFEQALLQSPDDEYCICAFSDFLLSQGDPARVLDLVAGKPPSAGLMLRRVLAEKTLGSSAFPVDRERLRTMLEAAEGSGIHLREHARFELEIENDPVRAAALARRNWAAQRESADTLLLLRAAKAANDAEAVAEVVAWAGKSGFRHAAMPDRAP